ncbi:hypothetical protein SAMCCGM7_Ch2072 [Sinorhizobium americanum CCGM7]|nr:hypothetical protein SAMCCGM7_Ch2072 [Sinorhizobium americanum CCGM7]
MARSANATGELAESPVARLDSDQGRKLRTAALSRHGGPRHEEMLEGN